jgi:hypothetical protein
VEEEFPADQALAAAIHISGLASHRQEEALARLPRAGRIKVGARPPACGLAPVLRGLQALAC